MNYNDLYGISLSEYIKKQNTTLKDLQEKVKTDIDLLKQNLGKVIQKEGISSYAVTLIHNTISKKETHLQRLKDWGMEKDNNEKV